MALIQMLIFYLIRTKSNAISTVESLIPISHLLSLNVNMDDRAESSHTFLQSDVDRDPAWKAGLEDP